MADVPWGEDKPCYIVAEIGINHNGSLETAKKLIDAAVDAGVDAVKFQKRTVEVVYTAEELARPRESPFGKTNGDLKRGLEFSLNDYMEIDKYCRAKKNNLVCLALGCRVGRVFRTVRGAILQGGECVRDGL